MATNLSLTDEQRITSLKQKSGCKNRVIVPNQFAFEEPEFREENIAWRNVIFWHFLGVCLPTFDVYSDIVYMIVNLMQYSPVDNDFDIPENGDCFGGKYINTSYCQLSYSEQCKFKVYYLSIIYVLNCIYYYYYYLTLSVFTQCRQKTYISGRSSNVSCDYVKGLSYSMAIPLLVNFGFTARYW